MGQNSLDPDAAPEALTFAWTLVEKPTDSVLTTADIVNPTQALASLTPDVLGNFVLQLTVFDGEFSMTDETVVRVDNQVPVAHAVSPANVETGCRTALEWQSFL